MLQVADTLVCTVGAVYRPSEVVVMMHVIDTIRSLYVLVSESRLLLAQNNILIQYRAPKRADPDQPNAISLCSARGRYLDVCACFLGSTWKRDLGLSYELLWAFGR